MKKIHNYELQQRFTYSEQNTLNSKKNPIL